MEPVPQPLVYLDLVFLINLLMDYIILWATARLGQIHTTRRQLALGALLGAVYSVLFFVPGLSFLYALFFRLFISLVIIAVAFYPLTWGRFFHACGYFYFVAFTMGGAVLGAIYLLSSWGIYGTFLHFASKLEQISFLWLFPAVVVAILLARWGALLIRRTLVKSFFRVPLTISFGERDLTIPALLDTGNQLKDPLTRAPVVIAEYSALEPFLPEDLREVFRNASSLDLKAAVERFAASAWSHRIRLIPFSSIGRHHGMMLGLKPDAIQMVLDNRVLKTQDVVIGVYEKNLCPHGSYRALVHPELLEMAMTA